LPNYAPKTLYLYVEVLGAHLALEMRPYPAANEVRKQDSNAPQVNFRYNPLRRGEMAEWLKAAVC
jgi:hypothetical protein